MKYLKEYKDFYSSIKDPLEKLDEVQVELDGLEIATDQINGNYELGGIPEEEYESLSKEMNSFFEFLWIKKWNLCSNAISKYC